MPLLSVIMSTYNEEKYIEESLNSMLKQTFKDFEIIIFDDCSTDRTNELIRGMAQRDNRIRLYRNEENQGLTKNLNQALKLVTCTKYIARMDGDDIAEPTRFEKQIAFMDAHPNTMLSSVQTRNFGDSHLINHMNGTSEELRVRMLIRPVFAHPGFMMRKELVTELGYQYDENFRTAQDYDFAARVGRKCEIGIVPEILLNYRVHKKQVSNTSGAQQYTNADKVRNMLWENLGLEYSGATQNIMKHWVEEDRNATLSDFFEAKGMMNRLVEANQIHQVYNPQLLEKTLKTLLYTWLMRTKNWKLLSHALYICDYQIKNIMILIRIIIQTIGYKISD